MTLQIGRLGLAPSLDNPESLAYQGEILTISGTLDAATINDAKALRQQLLGLLNNPDESIVPVIWSEDSWVDGFYRVLDVAAGTVPASLYANWFPFSITLQRVSDYAAPMIESILLGPGIRDNEHTLTESEQNTTNHAWFMPASVDGTRPFNFLYDYIGEDGDIVGAVRTENQDSTIPYLLDPADWYESSSRLELDYADNGTFRPVVGRQIIDLAAPSRWRLSNGLIRLTLVDNTAFQFNLEHWRGGSGWSSAIGFAGWWAEFPVALARPTTLTVLRNAPQDVVIRLTGGGLNAPSGEDGNTYRIDIRLQRGRNYVEVVFSGIGDHDGVVHEWQIRRSSNEAAEEFDPTGLLTDVGIRATADNGEDISWAIITPSDYVADTTNGRLEVDPDEVLGRFGVGLNWDDTSGNHPRGLGTQLIARAYFAPIYETVRVVER